MSEITSSEYYERVRIQRSGIHPAHWPAGVEIITQNGLELLGVGPDGSLYLDGKKLYTERRLATQERVLAWIVAIFTAVGAVAAACEVWA